jgi:hypothetical protein
MLSGEIEAFNYYRLLGGKTKGTRSTPYYSIDRNYPQIINEKSYEE